MILSFAMQYRTFFSVYMLVRRHFHRTPTVLPSQSSVRVTVPNSLQTNQNQSLNTSHHPAIIF